MKQTQRVEDVRYFMVKKRTGKTNHDKKRLRELGKVWYETLSKKVL